MATVNDAELLMLYNESRSDLFPSPRQEGALAPLVVLLAVLPAIFALIHDGMDASDARWGLESLELLSTPDPGAIIAAQTADAHAAWRNPVDAALTGLALQIPGVSAPAAMRFLPFVCAVGIVLVWHALCRHIAGPRFAFCSTVLLACHGSFLAYLQSSASPTVPILLALCALWGYVSHLREADGFVSGRLFIGGTALGILLPANGATAACVLALLVMQATAMWLDAIGQSKKRRNAAPRGRSLALKSVGVLAMTAFAIGGWWVMMFAAARGPRFWGDWLGFRPASAGDMAARSAEGIGHFAGACFHLVDLMGFLLVPALFGVYFVVHGLLTEPDRSRRITLQFLAAWLITGFVAWSARLTLTPGYGGIWNLFILLPLIGCASLSFKQVVVRRIGPILTVWMAALAFMAPSIVELVRRRHAGTEVVDASWDIAFIVGYSSASLLLTLWILLAAHRNDDRQRVCLAALLMLLAGANALQGLSGARQTDEETRKTRLLNEFHNSLTQLENVDAQILVTDESAPPEIEFILEATRLKTPLETVRDWDAGMARAAEMIAAEKRNVLLVDWRSVDERGTRPPEKSLNVDSQFGPVILHDRRLFAFVLTRRIQPM